MKKLLFVFILFVNIQVSGQTLQLFDPASKWILKTPKIEKKELIFVQYQPEKVDLNTMIWVFLPNGHIEYDYESSEDVYACAGVDFLDMDLPECRWAYNRNTLTLTLQIKGGYASMDDFTFKRIYTVSILDSEEYGYVLSLDKELFFNDLTRLRK